MILEINLDELSMMQLHELNDFIAGIAEDEETFTPDIEKSWGELLTYIANL